MSQMFRVGIVGCGNHVYEFLLESLKWTPAAHVVAACDPDPARLQRLTDFYNVPGRYPDIRDMLASENLDAVVVAVGHGKNAAIVQAALAGGVHVFVEKTPCNSVAEAQALAAAQRRSGKALMVGFNRRFMTAYALAREVAHRDEFGQVRMYHSQFHATPYRSEALLKLNHVIHHIDLARFILGEIHLTHADRIRLDDQHVGLNISFRSEAGAIGVIQSASMLDEVYPMERLELIGDRRNIVVDNVKGFIYNRPPVTRKDKYVPLRIEDGGDALVWNPSHGFYPRYSHHGYENELRHFFDSLAQSVMPQPDIHDSVKTMMLLDELEALLQPADQEAEVAA